MNDLIHRNASPWISDLLDHFPVVVLQGGRQVGKSTLAADIAGHRHGNIVTMDNDNARTAATTDPAGRSDVRRSSSRTVRWQCTSPASPRTN